MVEKNHPKTLTSWFFWSMAILHVFNWKKQGPPPPVTVNKQIVKGYTPANLQIAMENPPFGLKNIV